MSKKVLIITYYWPPKGGAGVFRWLQLTKYFPEFNLDPFVYTPENGEVPVMDETLLADVSSDVKVVKYPIWEPFGLYKKLFSGKKVEIGFLEEKKASSKTGWLTEFAKWIRGNIFIPDSRMFWIKPSIKFLNKWIEENPIDAIISSGPPHSCHLIALKVSRKNQIPWIADFRDPWTNIDFNQDLKITKWAFKRNRKLEQKVLEQASKVVTISEGMAREFEGIYKREYNVIPNGFDPAHYTEIGESNTQEFLINYIGTVNKARNPSRLWKVLGESVSNNDRLKAILKIRFIGKVDYALNEDIDRYGLSDNFEHIPFLEHKKAIRLAGEASVSLLLINNAPNAKGILTGKMFEYFGIGRPILCIGPTDGDAAKVIKETGSGITVGYNDEEGIKKALDHFILKFEEGQLTNFQPDVAQYSRVENAAEFSKLIENIGERKI